MKLPNSYGSVYKLSGKRRKPWVARVTTGWKTSENTKSAQPVYYYIGYYSSRSEALTALAQYNNDPSILQDKTLADVYEEWSAIKYEESSIAVYHSYSVAWKSLEPIYNKRIKDLNLNNIQTVIDNCGKNTPTKKNIKTVIQQLYKYAYLHNYINNDMSVKLKYLDVGKDYDRRVQRRVFTKEEIREIWKDKSQYAKFTLMLIYTGCRISELLNLKKEDVHITQQYFEIKQAKTKAGIRQVPIAFAVLPFFNDFMQTGGKDLIPFSYYKEVKYLEQFNHLPHDTRHTFVSFMQDMQLSPFVIKSIIGHSAETTTDVYTHIDIEAKIYAVNQLQNYIDSDTLVTYKAQTL